MKDSEDKAALDVLSGLENTGDVKFDNEKPKKKTSLGKASTSLTSGAGDSPWKLISLDNLHSRGIFYPIDFEFLIKSAKTKEIRHWSTIDQYDPIDIFEKIAFITESCSRMNIRGKKVSFNSNDILEVDKYQALFKIHKITFPNNENNVQQIPVIKLVLYTLLILI